MEPHNTAVDDRLLPSRKGGATWRAGIAKCIVSSVATVVATGGSTWLWHRTWSPREIWEAAWQNDDGSGSKPRPIIVLTTSLLSNEVWAVGVTSQSRHVARGNCYQVFGDFDKESFAMCADPRVLRRRDLLCRRGQLDRRQASELVALVQPYSTA